MTNEYQHNYAPKHGKKQKNVAKTLSIIAAVIIFCGLIGTGAYFAARQLSYKPESSLSPAFQMQDTGNSEDDYAQNGLADTSSGSETPGFSDKQLSSQQMEQNLESQVQEQSSENALDGFPIPLIATYEDVVIHSPVHPRELEGIIFHQAATESGLVMTTQLPEANAEEMEENPDYKIAETQPVGNEWLDAYALHLWREDTPTEMDTSIDVGAEAGTQVYAPVTGTVILVTTYNLYDVVEDYEVHIQPDGRPDLDVVEIHIQDIGVKAGQAVEGGVTPLAKVRNLAGEDITDIQLAYYTKEGHGNHTHVQVNNVTEEYKETRLKDAYKVE